ncbi:MAG: mannose-1-phosphate guanyltransferase, partial [Candidatus Margulisbacteria bacterium]|nr:mannose-1-phosphate guanyltransferase [Candidatus Margulisiibacteriota bacterium]
TRLHPLTVNIPKPMIPVANQPLMEYVIYLLRKHKIKDVTALLYHQPETIKNYFGDGGKFGVNISYVEAKEDYGTAGAVRFAAQNFKEPFLVISADLITDFDLEAAVKFHNEKKAMATLVLTRVANPLQYGIVITGKDGRIKHFLEKPSWSEVFSDTVNCGIYVLDPSVFEYIPSGRPVDFSQDLFPQLLAEAKPIYGFVAEGLWKDIGNLVEYGRVHSEIAGGREFQIAKEATISPSARKSGVVIVGEKTVIGDDVVLEDVSIGRKCHISRGAQLHQCVIWDNVAVGADARLDRTIVARDTTIGDRAVCEEGVVIGEECNIGADADIKPYVKVWPNRVIEEGAVVSRSMVWRERWAKNIFGPYGVTGLCNVEMTPEFAATLGAAYGSFLGKGSRISASRDSHKSSRMIYRALLSGVLSAGVNVSDLEMVPIPVNRYELKALKSRGGFHVRKSPYDQQVIDIKFFDENGMDLPSVHEKKIERLFFGEDFKRMGIEEVGDLNFPFHRVAESYKEGVLNCIDKELVSARNFKVVIDYAYSSASQIFPAILGELGIEVIALNAHIDETKITKSRAMFEKAHCQLSSIVKSLDADLGIMLDTGAEKIFLCDEKGKIFQGDLELAIMTILFCRAQKGSEIGVPVKASRVIDEVAKKYGGRVIRTKTSIRDMMENCYKGRMKFLGETAGGFIFPQFQCAFDAMFASLKLLEMLAREDVKLSAIAAEVPRINMVSKEVSCAAEQKGKVLRTIVDSIGDDEVDLTDGVKIFHGHDWALILPDPARPVIHLYAEAESEKLAHKLIDKYVEKIDSII